MNRSPHSSASTAFPASRASAKSSPALPRIVTLVLLLLGGIPAGADAQLNPYRPVESWGNLSEGREWGAVTGVHPARDGGLWVMERCGAQYCFDRPDLNPILKLDAQGNVVRQFGAGIFSWPHGLFVDHEENVWATDAEGAGGVEGDGKGHAVYKFSAEGELLLTLGEPGVAGSDPHHFDQPNDVLVLPTGEVFVADGHGNDGNNRVLKYDAEGNFLMEWGGTGVENGLFREPHTLSADSRGRIFVGDRGNNRIQIFTSDGEFLEEWTQFGRPSGIFITPDDVILVADSDSNPQRNLRGWARGIRIGSARDGWVRYLIPDPEHDPVNAYTSGAEFVAMDESGVVWGGEIGPRNLQRYVPLYDPFLILP